MCACVCVHVCHTRTRADAQLCPPLCSPMDCNLSDSSVHGILRQEYWSELPLSAIGVCLTHGSNQHLLCLLHWQADSLPLVQPGYMPHIKLPSQAYFLPHSTPFPRRKNSTLHLFVLLFPDIFKSSNKMHIYVAFLSFFG